MGEGLSDRFDACFVACFVAAVAACSHAPPAASLSAAPGDLDAAKLLAAPAQAARDAGAGELLPIAAHHLAEGEMLGSFVTAAAEECVLVLSRGGGGIGDVDIFVYDDSGDRISADEAPEAHAAVLVCPPHPRRFYVVTRAVSGTGIVALGLMRVPAAAADAVSKAVAVRGRPGEDTGKLDAWPGLERRIRERRAELGSSWEDVRRVAVPLSPSADTTLSVDIPARRCLDVLVTPSDEVQAIDVLVLDAAGRVLARGRPPGRDRAFVLCSELETAITISARPRGSAGMAAVIIARSPEGAASELAERTWIDGASPIVPLDQALTRHAARTKALRMDPPGAPDKRTVPVGVPTVIEVSLGAGCSRIDLIGGAPLGPFSAELWSDDGRRLAAARGAELATAFVCGPAQKVKVEVAGEEREGPLAVQVRRDANPAPVLLAHPLAATRLLGRLEELDGPIDPKAAAAAVALQLEPDRREEQTLELAAGRCAVVVAAFDEGMSGLGLTLVPAPPAEPTLTRAASAAAQRICAAKSPITSTAQLTAARGKGAVLYLTLPVSD